MAGLLEYTKNGQVTEPPLYRFMRGNVQSFLNSIPDPSKMTPEEQLALGANVNPIMGLLGATAYHGSPAIFDKFDINKLGSGEGAQAYGHGMYFAENPKVAEDYAKKLGIEKTSMSQLASDYLKQDVPPSAIRMLHDVATSSTPIEEAARKVQGGSIALRNESPDVLKNIVSDFRSQSAGKLYKVDIPDEYIPKMLDWDKPLSEQNSFIKNAFQYNEPSISNLEAKLTGSSNPDWKYSVDGYPAAPTQKQAIENAMNSMKSSSWYTGNTGEQLYRDIAKKYATQNNPLAFKEASNELSKLGITGIKYLDQGSRKASGTSNYVVFDPSNVEILERNNMGLLK